MSDKEELREIAQAMLAVEGHLQACCACCTMEQCITAKTEYNLAFEAFKRAKSRLNILCPQVNWEKENGDKILGLIAKCLSGRFLFTICTAIVFLYATWKGILNNEQIVAIIMLVVSAYFSKTRSNGGSVK